MQPVSLYLGNRPIRVLLDEHSSTAYAPGIRLSLPLKKESRIKRQPEAPLLLEEVFSPFFDVSPKASLFMWWEVLDLIAENLYTSTITILVLTSDPEHSRWEEVGSILEDQSRLKVPSCLIWHCRSAGF